MASSLVSVTRYVRASPLAFFAVAYGATAALQKAIGFALFMWLAHSLSVEEYATFGLLYALQAVLAGVAGAGIVESIIGLLKDHNTTPLRAKLFSAANSAFVLLALPSIVIVAVIYGAMTHDIGASFLNLLFVIVTGILTAFFLLQASLVRLEERHPDSLILGFAAPLAGFAGAGIGFILGQNTSSFFAGSAIGLAISLIPWMLYRGGWRGFSKDRREVARILSIVSPFVLIAVLAWLSGYGNSYLVKAFFTKTDVARFTFAFTLASILQLVATSLNQVWSPRFFRLIQDLPIEQVEDRNRRFFSLQGIALGLVGGSLLVVIPMVLQRAGGNLAAYSGMSLEFFFLFAAYAVSIPCWHAQNYFYAYGKGTDLMRVTIIGSAVGLLLWLLAMWLFGVTGVYVGFMLQMLSRTLCAAIWAKRQWGINADSRGAAAAIILLAIGAMVSAEIS